MEKIENLVAFIYFSHVQTLMYNLKKSKYTFICSLTSVIVNIFVAICLVKYLDVYAILIAQFVSQAVMAILAVIMGRSAERVDFGLKKMILFIVEAALLMGVGMFIDYSNDGKIGVLGMILKIFILCVGFLLFIFPYRKDFGELILGLFKKKKKEDK